jgi:carbonic anhydrase
MKPTLIFITRSFIALTAAWCGSQANAQSSGDGAPIPPPYKVSHVMTKEQQQALKPADVLKEFVEGNQRFSRETITRRDHSAMVRKTAGGQYPKAVVLSCLDSRIPVEDVLDQGLGDIFVARVAGNVLNEDILGSMEFGCKVSGAKLILVIGHRNCGAVKGAIDEVQLGNITALLSKIKPAIDNCASFKGEKSSKNMNYVETVCNSNIDHVVNEIRRLSPILAQMEKAGELMLVGAYYDLDNGELSLLK